MLQSSNADLLMRRGHGLESRVVDVVVVGGGGVEVVAVTAAINISILPGDVTAKIKVRSPDVTECTYVTCVCRRSGACHPATRSRCCRRTPCHSASRTPGVINAGVTSLW